MNTRLHRFLLVTALISCIVFGIGTVPAVAEVQRRFESPQRAADALADAADTGDPASFAPLFGSEFTAEVSSGDVQADRLGVQRLATLMRQGYKVTPRGPHKSFIEVGADKWLFPLPVKLTTDGDWAFDAAAGQEALLKRRIEKNEARAILIAQHFAAAQREYRTMTGIFAAKLLGSSGKKDGLFWETGPDGVASPLAPLVDRAKNLGYEKKGNEIPLLSGYYFRVLTAQGEYAPGKTQSYIDGSGKMTKGFALIAYPSRYGVSGKRSFIVGAQEIVYSRDIGERTDAVVSRIQRYDPDPSWHPIAGDVAKEGVRVISTSDGAYPFSEW